MNPSLSMITAITLLISSSALWAQDEEKAPRAEKLEKIDIVEDAARDDEIAASLRRIEKRLAALEDERRELVKELQTLRRKQSRRLRSPLRGPRGFGAKDPFQLRVMGSGQNLKMKTLADGTVQVEIEERDENGTVERKRYEAESMDALKKMHPDLFDRGPLAGLSIDLGDQRGWGARVPNLRRTDFGDLRQRLEEMQRQMGGALGPISPRSPFLAPRSPQPTKDRLGVIVESISEDRADSIGVDPSLGLTVRQVVPKSLAWRLGLKKGDVMLKINGRSIDGVAVIADALRATSATETVTIEIDRDGQGRSNLEATKTLQKKPAKKRSQKI